MWGNQMLPDSHLYHSETLCKKYQSKISRCVIHYRQSKYSLSLVSM
uniref:Alternative protein C1QL3 n=1 Tax=Homo sapiens TaxID=9606 RepID=L8EC65_HUMAN|nr:alternative protein C1QL3 [Homo sapiens]